MVYSLVDYSFFYPKRVTLIIYLLMPDGKFLIKYTSPVPNFSACILAKLKSQQGQQIVGGILLTLIIVIFPVFVVNDDSKRLAGSRAVT